MRIISGIYKGRILNTLEGKNTRPTSVRVKTDMFNILSNYFIWENKQSLDLFGGSGSLSIEGISKGIKKAYINDKSKAAVNIIKKNTSFLNNDLYDITNLDWLDAIKLYDNRISFDLIYFDPPFANHEFYYQFFDIINKVNILNNYGIVSVQSEFELDINIAKNLVLLKYKAFKNKYYYAFRKEEE